MNFLLEMKEEKNVFYANRGRFDFLNPFGERKYFNLFSNKMATKYHGKNKRVHKVEVVELNGRNRKYYWAWQDKKGNFSMMHKEKEKVWRQSRDGFYSQICEDKGNLVEVIIKKRCKFI